MKLYRVTGKEKYKDMARFFLEERGKNPNYFYEEKQKRGWNPVCFWNRAVRFL